MAWLLFSVEVLFVTIYSLLNGFQSLAVFFGPRWRKCDFGSHGASRALDESISICCMLKFSVGSDDHHKVASPSGGSITNREVKSGEPLMFLRHFLITSHRL